MVSSVLCIFLIYGTYEIIPMKALRKIDCMYCNCNCKQASGAITPFQSVIGVAKDATTTYYPNNAQLSHNSRGRRRSPIPAILAPLRGRLR